MRLPRWAQVLLCLPLPILFVIGALLGPENASPAPTGPSQSCLAAQRMYGVALAQLSLNAQLQAYQRMLFLCDNILPVKRKATNPLLLLGCATYPCSCAWGRSYTAE